MAKLDIISIRREPDDRNDNMEHLIFDIWAAGELVKAKFVVVKTIKAGAPISQEQIDQAESKVRKLAESIAETS